MTTRTVSLALVRVDEENNATEWWDALDASPELAPVAEALRRNGEAEVDRPTWNRLVALPGWHDGPEYAPTPIYCVNDYEEEACQ